MYKIKRKLSKEKFAQFYLEFIKKYGGLAADPQRWYDTVVEKHQSLNEFLGSHEVSHTFKMKKTNHGMMDHVKQNLLNLFKEGTGMDLNQVCPEALNHIGSEDITDKHKRKVKTPRYIRSECSKFFSSFFSKEGFDKKMRGVDRFLGSLAEETNKIKIKSIKIRMTVTTDPKYFARLGHYMEEGRSCFGQSGCYQQAKYNLGKTPNTFVVLAKHEGTIVARFWGYCNDERDIFVISNGYYGDGVHQKTINEAVPRLVAKIMGEKLSDLHVETNQTVRADSSISVNYNSAIVVKKDKNKKIPDLQTDYKKLPNDKVLPRRLDSDHRDIKWLEALLKA